MYFIKISINLSMEVDQLKFKNLKNFNTLVMFFLEAVIRTSLCLLLGV
jgi:hypothetical protein